MPRFLILISLTVTFLCGGFSQGKSQKKYVPPKSRILFVFDGSQSMNGYWNNNKKITIARQTLITLVDSLEKLDNVQMALRIYGHQSPVPPQDCNDTRLEVPFSEGNAPAIRQELRYINPKGTTPIANSLQRAAGDFPANCPDCRNIIILITDGIESCDGDPCAISSALQKKGVVLKPFVIGVGIDKGYTETFDCIGNYFNASDEEKFGEVLEVVIEQALNSTTAQVNLLNIKGKPTETNVNMTFLDHLSGKVKHNYMHTMNSRGLPDTLVLDHLVTYDLRVNTLPPVFVKNVKVKVGKHTIIKASCPQGKLLVREDHGIKYKGLKYAVKQANKPEILNFQQIGFQESYLVGKYDIEVPVLPRMVMRNVKIDQDKTTTITIPRPGFLNLKMLSVGYGSIYERKGPADEQWVTNINPDVKNETIVLQPGKYRVVFRARNARQVLYTIDKAIVIKSGTSQDLLLK